MHVRLASIHILEAIKTRPLGCRPYTPQVLCRADRSGGVIRFCNTPTCTACNEVPFNNYQCLINLPGLGALSYWLTCAPQGPFISDLGAINNVDVDVNVFTPIIVRRPPATLPGRYRLLSANGETESD